ncbi:hypothetical protein LCGC14_0542560 [marine sediment metagenome]|uniref:Uncharacterized protein n=1 Tax=marine sediment metagenome TaxID=412755 RepID=A0A0F9UDU8_9ZZZZ
MAIYEQYITGDDADASTWGANWTAQTFTPSTNHKCVGVNVYIGIAGTPGEMIISLRATDGNGLPTGADLISDTISAGEIDSIGTNVWVEASFSAGYNLIAGTTYAIVLRAVDGTGTSDDIDWRVDSSSPTYTGGSRIDSTDSGSNWTADTAGDLLFQERSGAIIRQDSQGDNNTGRVLYGAVWVATQFTTVAGYDIYGVGLKFKNTIGDAGVLTVSIRAVDGGNDPTGPDLASGTYVTEPLTSAGEWFNVTFTTRLSLSAATTYAIVCRCPSGDVNNTVHWMKSDVDSESNASTDSGSTWSNITTDTKLFKTYSPPDSQPSSDLVGAKKLVSVSGGEIYQEITPGTLALIDATIGTLEPDRITTLATGFGKVFVANDNNLKVLDFSSSKLTTASLGANPPDIGTVLTGGSSGAVMHTEYINALSGATTLYGFRTTTVTFTSGETVTGTDDDSNAVSFTISANESTPASGPYYYDWTVFGNSSTFGVMPENATLVTRYRGRLVLSGSRAYPHQWYMSRVASPFNFLYGANDPLSAVAGNNTDAGEIGDTVRAMIPYGDDFMVFGCADSIHILDGDPVARGSIDEVDESTGIHSTFSFCKDSEGNLYFWGQEGLYKMGGGRTKPQNIGQGMLPKWADDWAIDPALHRIVLTFDRRRNGVVVSKTTLTDGTNLNYWFSLKTRGLYPETYPQACGIFCSYDYKSNTPAYAGLVLGTNDGYLRNYLDTAKDDDSGSSDTAISSYLVLGPFPIGDGADMVGKLTELVFESAGGSSGGSFGDSDGFSYDIHVADDAETCIEDIKDGATPIFTGTVSGTGRTSNNRPRLRGMYYAIKVYNSTAAETFVLNRILTNRITAGRMRG